MIRRVNDGFIKLHTRFVISATESDRGDVPGWVMITLMTAVIVVLIWASRASS